MSDKGRIIALIGGGRWGRVHASNLSQVLTARDRVMWVSRHNQDILREAILKLPANGPAFELSASFEGAMSRQPTAVFVVTSPETHAGIAEACLHAGAHTFVEKPLAFTAAEAASLIKAAKDRNLHLAVGLHLLSASYLGHFKKQIAGRRIAKIALRWFDAAHEVRYGEAKVANESTPLAHDVYPHIWSIIRVLTDCDQQKIKSASEMADKSVLFDSTAGEVNVEAQCGRYSTARERKIALVFEDGGTANLDFTDEPGVALLDQASLPPDPRWGQTPRPVMAKTQAFLAQISSTSPDPAWPHFAANCVDSVAGAEQLQARLKQ